MLPSYPWSAVVDVSGGLSSRVRCFPRVVGSVACLRYTAVAVVTEQSHNRTHPYASPAEPTLVGLKNRSATPGESARGVLFVVQQLGFGRRGREPFTRALCRMKSSIWFFRSSGKSPSAPLGALLAKYLFRSSRATCSPNRWEPASRSVQFSRRASPPFDTMERRAGRMGARSGRLVA